MTEYRKGDVCSLEVTIEKVADANVGARTKFGCWIDVVPSDLTLIRRAPVDLASVEIPEDGTGVPVLYYGEPARLLGRQHRTAFLRNSLGNLSMCAIDYQELRPLDAPAPESEVERLRSALVGTHNALMKYEWYCNPKSGWASDDCKTLRQEVEEALVSKDPASSFAFRDENGDVQLQDTPTCPPCHIMIGNRAVPEPMRVVPEIGDDVRLVTITDKNPVFFTRWNNSMLQNLWLERGLIHSTEANARAHAEAIIALSAGEGV